MVNDPQYQLPHTSDGYVEFFFWGVYILLYIIITKVARIEDVLTIKESSFVPEQDVIISDCGEIKILNIEEC